MKKYPEGNLFINFLTCGLFERFKGEFSFIHSRVVLSQTKRKEPTANPHSSGEVFIGLVDLVICGPGYCRSLCGHPPTSPTTLTVPFIRSLLKQLGLNTKAWQPQLCRDPLSSPTVHVHSSTHQPALLPSHHWPQGIPLTFTLAADPGALYLPLAAVCPKAPCLFHNCLLLLESWQDLSNSVTF